MSRPKWIAALVAVFWACYMVEPFANAADRRPCTVEHVRSVDSKLPPFVEVAPGIEFSEAVSEVYACDSRNLEMYLDLSHAKRLTPALASRDPGPAAALTSPSLAPTNRVKITFVSLPPGATIVHGNKKWGDTELSGLVSLKNLREVEFKMDGYSNCKFDDSEFDEGVLYCKLKQK